MEIVIRISEKEYNYYRDDSNFWGYSKLREIILNGKPLPKGHGRLIDADRLKIDNPLHLGLDVPYVVEDTVEEIIDHAPTIIEADREK